MGHIYIVIPYRRDVRGDCHPSQRGALEVRYSHPYLFQIVIKWVHSRSDIHILQCLEDTLSPTNQSTVSREIWTNESAPLCWHPRRPTGRWGPAGLPSLTATVMSHIEEINKARIQQSTVRSCWDSLYFSANWDEICLQIRFLLISVILDYSQDSKIS